MKTGVLVNCAVSDHRCNVESGWKADVCFGASPKKPTLGYASRRICFLHNDPRARINLTGYCGTAYRIHAILSPDDTGRRQKEAAPSVALAGCFPEVEGFLEPDLRAKSDTQAVVDAVIEPNHFVAGFRADTPFTAIEFNAATSIKSLVGIAIHNRADL